MQLTDEMHRYETAEEETEEPLFTTQHILEAMRQLPEGGRVIFSLYLLEGYDHAEIASILNIMESTSKSQYMRAKRRVYEILKQSKMCEL